MVAQAVDKNTTLIDYKGNVMKSNKLFEMLDNLDSYAVEDPNEEITIDFIQVFSVKKGVEVDFCNLPDKSFKIFSVNDVTIGYIYFKDKDCICSFNNFFDNYDDDSEKNKISEISIQYVDRDLLTVKVHWNSLFYELDNGNNILLFMGVEA